MIHLCWIKALNKVTKSIILVGDRVLQLRFHGDRN